MADEKRRAKRGAKTQAGVRGAKTKASARGAKAKVSAREPLQSLAEQYGLTLDEVNEMVRASASEQIALAKSRAKLLRFKAAAEECVRAYAALDGIDGGTEKGARLLGQILGITESEHQPGRRPWLLVAIGAYEGPYGPLYAGDDEDREAVESRILFEFGASPNAIAASRDPAPNHAVRNYVSSAVARKARRDIERLCRKLSAEISELEQKRQSLDGDAPDGFKLGHMALVSHLDQQIANREAMLARLSLRRRS